jgi:hypothetical protein
METRFAQFSLMIRSNPKDQIQKAVVAREKQCSRGNET